MSQPLPLRYSMACQRWNELEPRDQLRVPRINKIILIATYLLFGSSSHLTKLTGKLGMVTRRRHLCGGEQEREVERGWKQ